MNEEVIEYRIEQIELKCKEDKDIIFEKNRKLEQRILTLEKSTVFVKGAIWLLTAASSIFAFVWTKK